MTDDVYKKIKRQNGERFAQTIRNYHNGLLQIEGIAEMVRHAGRDASPLLPYLMSLLASNDDKPVDALVLDPFVLLDQAGYDAFHTDTLEKQNSIKKYFAPGELLCTFNDAARHQNYHIIHAVKKDVDKIRREDFNGKAQRQDAYGTSVISIQIKKGGGFISIKNRYNHAVEQCDHTFDSNPDNIIQGLSAALKTHFNVEFTSHKTALPPGYVMIAGQIFKYNFERNNIYYGDQAWASDGVIHSVDRSTGDALFDCYLFDNKSKALRHIDPISYDSFPDDFNRDYGDRGALCVKNGNLYLGDELLITAENSAITAISLPELTELSHSALTPLMHLTHLSLPALIKMGDLCLKDAPVLSVIDLRALVEMGDNCLQNTRQLEAFDAPALNTIGEGCLQNPRALRSFNTPQLKTMQNCCLYEVRNLVSFNAPQLVSMGDRCLNEVPKLEKLHLARLYEMGELCLEIAWSLTHFEAPALRHMKGYCLYRVPELINVQLPELRSMNRKCLWGATSLREFIAPQLRSMAGDCLGISTTLERFEAPLLRVMGPDCLFHADKLRVFYAPRVKNLPKTVRGFKQKLDTSPPRPVSKKAKPAAASS